MECWKSTILASQTMSLLIPQTQSPLKVLESAYQWIDPITDKVVIDGHSILNLTLKLC